MHILSRTDKDAAIARTHQRATPRKPHQPRRSATEVEASAAAKAARREARDKAQDQAFAEKAAERLEAGIIPRMALASALKHVPVTREEREYELRSLGREIRLLQRAYDNLEKGLQDEAA